jgi:hypothetical protein
MVVCSLGLSAGGEGVLSSFLQDDSENKIATTNN